MEVTIRWSRLALADLRSIYRYIRSDSPMQADRIRTEIFDFAEGFADRPRGASMVPEMKDDAIRQWLFYGWRVIYQINERRREIVVMAVLHSKRDFVHIEERF